MCITGSDPVAATTTTLDTLAAEDVAALDDTTVREQVAELMRLSHRLHAELVRRVDVFDRRGLAEPDGFRTTRTWLQAFTSVSGAVAHRLVKAARLLRHLPQLAAATQTGDVCPEQVGQVARLADQIGAEQVTDVEETLTDAAAALDPGRFQIVCDRIRAHIDPDGPEPRHQHEQRGLTLSTLRGMLILRGQLDPEGGAALTTALDAIITPPADGDDRTPAQRRADALVDLARRSLTHGDLPTVGGQRPQIGVLLYPQALHPDLLAKLAEVHRDNLAGARLQQVLDQQSAARADWTRPDAPLHPSEQATTYFGRTTDGMRDGLDIPSDAKPTQKPGTEDTQAGNQPPPPAALAPTAPAPVTPSRPAWQQPGWADPPWLEHIGPISPVTAQRIACDADIWTLLIDPDNGMPLHLGRTHRLVPHWMRKALHARDRGCTWPGCTTPAAWTDAHHLNPWATTNGNTNIDECVLLCRHHHTLVHEAGWHIHLNPRNGHITITRPDGTPYHGPPRSRAWNGPTTQAA